MIKNSRNSFGTVFNKTNEGSHEQGTKHELATALKGRYYIGAMHKKQMFQFIEQPWSEMPLKQQQ
jgi:hypothetical protein